MGILSFILDVYENMRKTKTDVKPTKPQERKYDFNAGFSGSKRDDYKSVQNSEIKNINKENLQGDER